ncbi:phage tail collar fiber protein [Campylobacter pinnipediorum subsp. caledonicus]|uniref:Phage tail collar fiber protein n=1 Tax=Campylobacter pinnipediorum subsp. caledonicus TaxID=1874362 RepID=A0A1S6U821_9BACT|nr:phage tail protein [Campylobacter pinnipediorum]AQW87901.1 phage tail collar fiber protein [Campylobacter pinnipediorum subsp. caledonicus]
MSGTMITNVGLSKLIQATSNNNTIQLTHMAVGDGQGEINQDMTSLQNEKHRFSINAITINVQDNHILDVEGVINASIGGFYIREAGIFCDDGSLFAIAKVAESYKPLLDEGSAKDITISFKIQVSNTNLINLVVDNNVVLATRKWVSAEYYTKTKTDELFLKTETAEQRYLKKTDTIDAYTKQESNSKFALSSALSSYLTKVDASSTYATKSELNNKADNSRSYTKSESDSRFVKNSDTTDSPNAYKIAKYNSNSHLKAYQFQMTKSSDSGMNSSSYIPYMNSDGLIFKSSISNFRNAISIYSKSESDERYTTKSESNSKYATKSELSDSGVPAGTVIAFAGSLSNKPDGFLHCDGSSLSKSTYSKLYHAIGTTYGGSGSNFNLPDFRGIFLRGVGGNAASLGTKQSDEFKKHKHRIPVADTRDQNYYWNSFRSNNNYRQVLLHFGSQQGSAKTDSDDTAEGGVETRPQNYAIYWLIKY